METILVTYWISLTLFWGTILGKYLYDKGYNKREDEFQGNPVQWIVDGEKVVYVKHFDGKIIIKIQNKELVEVSTSMK